MGFMDMVFEIMIYEFVILVWCKGKEYLNME